MVHDRKNKLKEARKMKHEGSAQTSNAGNCIDAAAESKKIKVIKGNEIFRLISGIPTPEGSFPTMAEVYDAMRKQGYVAASHKELNGVYGALREQYQVEQSYEGLHPIMLVGP
jgi:hypothetical protein